MAAVTARRTRTQARSHLRAASVSLAALACWLGSGGVLGLADPSEVADRSEDRGEPVAVADPREGGGGSGKRDMGAGVLVVVAIVALLRCQKLTGDYRRGDRVQSLHAHHNVTKGMSGFVIGSGKTGHVKVYFSGAGVHEVSVHRTSRPHEFGAHSEDHHGGGLRKGDIVKSLTACGQAWANTPVDKDEEGHVVGPGPVPNTVMVDFGHTSGSVSLDSLMPISPKGTGRPWG